MTLDNFIRLADGLVEFEALVAGKKIPLNSVYVVAIHQDELKSKWNNIKAAYETYMQERAAEQEEDDGKAKPTTRAKSAKSIYDEEASVEEIVNFLCTAETTSLTVFVE